MDLRRTASSDDLRLLLTGLPFAFAVLGGLAFQAGLITQLSAYASIAVAVVAPPVGLVILAFLAPQLPPLGVVPPPGLNFYLVAAILLGCLLRLPIARPRLSIGAPLLILFGFSLFAFAQQVPEMLAGWTGDEAYLVGSLFMQLLTGTLAVVATALVIRGRRPYPFLAALVGSAVLASALGIASFEQTVAGPLANLLGNAASTYRATGSFGNPNYYGLFLASAICLAAGWMVGSWSRAVRWTLLMSCALLGLGVAFSQSRGAVLSLMAGLVALAFGRSRKAGIVAMAIGVGLVLFVYPLFVDWRLINLTGSDSASSFATQAAGDEGRLTGALAGPILFASSPLFGVGFGHYSYMAVTLGASDVRIAAHDWYLNVLGEMGLVGVILWGALMLAVIVRMIPRPPLARGIGFAVFGSVAVGSFFGEPPTSFQTAVLPVVALTAVLVGDWSRAARTPAGSDGHPRTGAG